MSRPRRFETGQTVRIEGHCSDADGSMHGHVGQVVGENHTERGGDGQLRTVIETRDGTVVSVPTKALKSEER